MDQSLEQAIQQIIAGINQKYIQPVPLQDQIDQFLAAQNKSQYQPQLVVSTSYGAGVPQTGMNGMTTEQYNALRVIR